MENYPRSSFYTVKSDNLKEVHSEVTRQKQLRSKLFKVSTEKYLHSQQRTWLKKQGKNHYIDFEEPMRKDLHKYFSSLPAQSTKTITAENLYEPLLAMGLVESRLQVKKLVDLVDSEKTGQIDFDKFLKILKLGEANAHSTDLARELNRIKAIDNSDVLPFNLIVSSYLRRMLSDYYMNPDLSSRTRGEKIFKSYIKVLGGGEKPRGRSTKAGHKASYL